MEQMPMRTSILLLPNELLVRILDEVPVLDVVLCRRICHKFKDIVDDNLTHQYRLECALASVKPRDSGQFDLLTSLNYLRNWRNVSIGVTNTIEYEIPSVDPDQHFVDTKVDRGLMAQVASDTSLVLTRLPSHVREIPIKQWRIDGLRVPLRVFETDYSQDLLVVVGLIHANGVPQLLEAHTLSLSTGRSHPEGLRVPMSITFDGRAQMFPPPQLSIGISDDHIAVLMSGNFGMDTELWIWDWRTGQRKLETYFEGSNMMTSSFILLAGQRIILPIFGIPFTTQPEDQMKLLVWTYQEPFPGRRRYDEIPITSMFSLPPLSRGIQVARIDAAGSAYSSHSVSDDLQVPFECDPKARLLLFNIILMGSEVNPISGAFNLFASADVIERYCHDPEPRRVSWQELSPHVRLIKKDHPGTITSNHISHTKCICLKGNEFGGETPVWLPPVVDRQAQNSMPLVIYDFEPKFSIRRDAQTGRLDNCEYFFEPTVIINSRVWKDTIKTGASCPYRKITTPLCCDSTSRMYSITEDCVVLANANGSSWRVLAS